jgi:serine/threonine protein kinase
MPILISIEQIATELNRVQTDANNDKAQRLKDIQKAFADPEAFPNSNVVLQTRLLAKLFENATQNHLEKGWYQCTLGKGYYWVHLSHTMICRPSKNPGEFRWEAMEEKPFGKGGFGTVYRMEYVVKAKPNDDGTLNITDVKKSNKVLKQPNAGEQASEQSLRREHNAIRRLEEKAHGVQIKISNNVAETSVFHLFIKYIKGENLSPKSVTHLSFAERIILAHSFLQQIANLHAKNLIHGDLKPENTLFDISTLSGRAIDFGTTEHIDDPGLQANPCKNVPGYTPSWLGLQKQNKNSQETNVAQYNRLRKTPQYDSFAIAGILGIIFGCENVLRHRHSYLKHNRKQYPYLSETKDNPYFKIPLRFEDLFNNIPHADAISKKDKQTIAQVIKSLGTLDQTPITATAAFQAIQPIYQSIIEKNIARLNAKLEQTLKYLDELIKNTNSPAKKSALSQLKHDLSQCKPKVTEAPSFAQYKNSLIKANQVVNAFNHTHAKTLEPLQVGSIKKILSLLTFPFSFLIGSLFNIQRFKTVGFFESRSAAAVKKIDREIQSLEKKGIQFNPS